MLIVPQHFLSSSNVSKAFADILLAFLVKRMKDMASPSPVSAAMLSLFRIVFGSVALFSENEGVLRPYLNAIVSQGMRLAQEVKSPFNYFSLLRALFRSIGGGKFELLYKEFLPLLPDLLTGSHRRSPERLRRRLTPGRARAGLMKMQARGPEEVREISIEVRALLRRWCGT
jgi:transformation/transcription domain-associated protein